MRQLTPLVVLLTLVCTGCFGASSTPASKVVPKDPTGLAKCKVAKSSASPLVTEWPASYKAHLEGMIEERAIVVNYSGCEMKILDGCRVEGSYKFKRTTLAKDTIEIKDEDELYAKVPLGAASLEGELNASGRLAIHTTIAGQMQLDGGIPELPKGGGCKGATHVIESLSIGAFELKSGGAIAARGGVDVGGAGIGAGHKSEESTVRSAGDSASCKGTKDEEPSSDCRSPIQVFLVPLEHAERRVVAGDDDDDDDDQPEDDDDDDDDEVAEKPKPRPRPAPQPRKHDPNAEPPADKSLTIMFEPPSEDGRWMLLGRGGELLCELPCTRRVGNNSGFKLQNDADRKEDIQVVKVPDQLGYSYGRTVKGVPQPAVANNFASILFYGGITVAVVGGIFAYTTCAQALDDSNTSSDKPSTEACGGWAGAAGGGVLIGTIGGIWWYSTASNEELIMTLVEEGDAKNDYFAPKVNVAVNGVYGTF